MEPLVLRIISAIATHNMGSESDAIHFVDQRLPGVWMPRVEQGNLIAAEFQ